MGEHVTVLPPDIQAPLHDKPAVEAFTQFVTDYQPDQLACVGDEADNKQISRWVKGTKEEFVGNLQAGLDATFEVMAGLREAAPNASFIVQRSNHTTERIKNYVERYAPGLATLRALDWQNLMRYGELDVSLSLKPTPVAPGWLMMHGDEGGLNRTAGGTALGLARLTGKSVVCGHTHKLGLQHDNYAHSGRVHKWLFGMEVGHLMDMRQADAINGGYLKTGGANWNQGFGILHVVNGKTHPQVVPIVGRQFTVDGQVYSW